MPALKNRCQIIKFPLLSDRDLIKLLRKINRKENGKVTVDIMRKIVDLKEMDYRDKDEYGYAPQNFEDAMDSYDKVMEIVGDICANVIAPNAEAIMFPRNNFLSASIFLTFLGEM